MKKWYIIAFIVVFIVAVFSGYLLFKSSNKTKNSVNTTNNTIQEEASNSTNSIANEVTIETVETGEKITPNTELVLKKYYKDCNHTINEYVEMPSEMINLSKEELQEEYKDWQIEDFSAQKVILLKEEKGNCNQHYIVKEKDGIIAIYKIDENGDEILKEETSISTEYLTATDLIKIKEGIKVYGQEQLNSVIEDFE